MMAERFAPTCCCPRCCRTGCWRVRASSLPLNPSSRYRFPFRRGSARGPPRLRVRGV